MHRSMNIKWRSSALSATSWQLNRYKVLHIIKCHVSVFSVGSLIFLASGRTYNTKSSAEMFFCCEKSNRNVCSSLTSHMHCDEQSTCTMT